LATASGQSIAFAAQGARKQEISLNLARKTCVDGARVYSGKG